MKQFTWTVQWTKQSTPVPVKNLDGASSSYYKIVLFYWILVWWTFFDKSFKTSVFLCFVRSKFFTIPDKFLYHTKLISDFLAYKLNIYTVYLTIGSLKTTCSILMLNVYRPKGCYNTQGDYMMTCLLAYWSCALHNVQSSTCAMTMQSCQCNASVILVQY